MSEDLPASLRQKQIRAVIVCEQHPTRILGGRHRAKHLGPQARRANFDCDALAKELGISHALAEMWVQVHDNIQRQVPEEERRQELTQIALELEKQGVAKPDIAGAIAKLFPLSDRRIRELLPDEYKHMEKANVGDAAALPHNPNAKSPTQHTAAAQLLEAAISYYPTIKADFDFIPFERGELTQDGKMKTYQPDILIHGKNGDLILEIEGEGSASADNPKREEFFKEKGIPIIHIPNQMAQRWSREIAELVAVLTK